MAISGGGQEWLIDADGRDLLLVLIPGRVHYPVDRVKALETPGCQVPLGWSPEEAVAMQIAFRVVLGDQSVVVIRCARGTLAIGSDDHVTLCVENWVKSCERRARSRPVSVLR